jgi:hypothetical protein
MPSWSIEIIVDEDGVTSFDPPNQDAMQDDNVSWSNTTDESHQPWMLQGEDGPPVTFSNPFVPADRFTPNYMSDEILPGDPSTPGYNVTSPSTTVPDSWIVYYYCNVHPERDSERGTITGHAPGKGTTNG